MEYMEGMVGHAPFFSLIGVLAAFIQLKYGTLSPFRTHHAIITMFFVAVLVYVVASTSEVNLEATHFKSIAGRTSLLAGILAPVLLIIILDPKMGWLLFFLWFLFFIWVVYNLRQELSQLRELLGNAVLQARPLLYNAVPQAPARLYNAVLQAPPHLYNAVLQAPALLYHAVLQAYAAHGMVEEPNGGSNELPV